MAITIFGAGAIGSAIGAKLVAAGEHVTLIGRGAHAAAIRQSGVTLLSRDQEQQVPVRIVTQAQELPKQGVVIVCLKAHALADAAEDIAHLLHEESRVVFAVNGIPWWYFHRHPGKFAEAQLRSLDPAGHIWRTIGPERALGCVVYLASRVEAPGRVRIIENSHSGILLGELSGVPGEMAENLAGMIDRSGIATRQVADIRSEIWFKLWGNIAFNPITALTHATQDAVAEEYHDTDLIEAIMNEARFVAEKIGIFFPEGPKSRIEKAASMRGHKTSMLQDIEQGRPTEIEAIVGAVREIGQWVGAETPHLNGLYSLVRLKERFYRPVLSPAGGT